MKTIKTIFLTRIRYILLLSALLAPVLLISYSAIANVRRASTRNAGSTAGVSPGGEDTNPEYLEQRREFLDRFYGTGPGKVSPAAYAKGVAAARTLPLIQLYHWSFPPLSPMYNDWGHGGDPCPIPSPTPLQNSPCGASARIDAIAVDPVAANGDVVYVGTEGGLSKSTDGGQNWSYLSGNLNSQSFRSIAIDPVAPNIIYAGTGTNQHFGVGMYRSFDSGATWTLVGATQLGGGKVFKVAIDPATAGSQTSTTLYAGVIYPDLTYTVWQSTDSGSTWVTFRSATGAGGNSYDILIDPSTAPSTVYVTEPDGVFRKNRFPGWTSIHDLPNGGTTSSALALAHSWLYLAYKAADGSTTIVRSNNQGSNWTNVPAPCVYSPPPTWCADLYCFGVDPVHVDPSNNPTRLFVGGGGDLAYTLDAGNTWIRSHDVHVDMHAIAFCNSNSDRTYLGTDGGIHRADYTSGSEIRWWSKNERLAGSLMYGISISSDDHMVMGNQDNGTQKGYVGQNPPWVFIYGGDGWKPKVDPNNSSRYYYVYYTGTEPNACPYPPFPPALRVGPDSQAPARVVNGVYTNVTPAGAYCERTEFFPTMFVAFFFTPPNSANHVIMGFENVWRSTDSGDSWTRIGLIGVGSPIRAIYEAPSNVDVIYAVVDNPNARVFVTSNAGQGNNAMWTDRTAGTPASGINAVTVHPTDPATAYLSCASNLYKTTDTGAHWAATTAPPNLVYRDVAIDPNNSNRIFAASDAGVYASTNGGASWGYAGAGIPAGMSINTFSFNATTRQLAASTYGRGVYILDLDDVPPAVAITSPHYGDTVRGTITVSATASDNHRVVGVQFKLDGNSLGNEVTSPPYSISWDTTTTTNGAHTLTAVARDPAGNFTTSAPITVTVSN
jgi:photosystem II stability/assembly factor-like uncharacterized protein